MPTGCNQTANAFGPSKFALCQNCVRNYRTPSVGKGTTNRAEASKSCVRILDIHRLPVNPTVLDDWHRCATEHLTAATNIYREMDMRFWLEKAEAELK